eukprot:350051-Chlamydomonas_euryale.AAC.5
MVQSWMVGERCTAQKRLGADVGADALHATRACAQERGLEMAVFQAWAFSGQWKRCVGWWYYVGLGRNAAWQRRRGAWCADSVVWCGVVWCGVVWCGVVWCGVDGVCMWGMALPEARQRTESMGLETGCDVWVWRQGVMCGSWDRV